jgi:hypothetical protein
MAAPGPAHTPPAPSYHGAKIYSGLHPRRPGIGPIETNIHRFANISVRNWSYRDPSDFGLTGSR